MLPQYQCSLAFIVGDNPIEVDGAMWISNALELNKSLLSLNLSKLIASIGNCDIKMQGAVFFFTAIRMNIKLVSLNLSKYRK